MRIGIGYDVHRLVPDRPLVLGGVTIPYDLGLLGHSDADVLTHAVMDALLGAAGLGDIGEMFPDKDTAYRGISSLVLLDRVGECLRSQGYTVGNIDAVIIAEQPKVAHYRREMAQNLARALRIPADCVHIKGTTTEGLGFEGAGQGIGAQAAALLMK